MKILFDHQAFTGKAYGGISRYYTDLMQGLMAQNQEVDLSACFSNNVYLQNIDAISSNKYGNFIGSKTPSLISHINRACSAFHLCRQQFDLFHPTHYNDYFFTFIRKKPFVVTFHDAIPDKFKQYHRIDGYTTAQKQQVLNKASHIIAISKHTKEDIEEIYKIPSEKISVVHHGTHFVDASWQSSPTTTSQQPPYLLYIGARNDYKNFPFFLKAIANWLIKNDVQLICTGGGEFDATEKQLLHDLGIANRTTQQSVDDAALGQLYQNALAFVYPSIYEGFGIPIIEAFANGCPVILSRASCFPEVAQEGGTYFDPTSSEDLVTALDEVIFDTDYRANKIALGKQLAQQYSLQKMVRNTLDVYKKVVG